MMARFWDRIAGRTEALIESALFNHRPLWLGVFTLITLFNSIKISLMILVSIPLTVIGASWMMLLMPAGFPSAHYHH